MQTRIKNSHEKHISMLNRIYILVLVVVVAMSLLACGDNAFPPEQLPEEIIDFVQKHFADKKIVSAEKNWDWLGTKYSVTVSDSTKISFNASNEWDEVESPSAGVPASMVPAQVASYVRSNVPGVKITKIEKESSDFEVELEGDAEVKLNEDGLLIERDD